ncbi:MAG TPA: hypothetical protein VFP84_27810 [Kofleriaceae bacterium]|nr:hypothetical protein [Kofleriaceae bacterium]
MPTAHQLEAGAFTDRLAVTLTLTISGTAHTIAGGAVRDLALELHSYGFSGALTFVVHDDHAHGGGFTDQLRADFIKPDLIEVALGIAPVLVWAEAAAIQPITVAGLVIDKSIRELSFRKTADQPVLVRSYRIVFADPAQVLWGQHYPSQLYTNKAMTDVINDHLGDKITISYDFSALSQSRPLVFLYLPQGGASFWDFLSWYLAGAGGVLTYDYAAAAYKISATKSTSGTPIQLFGDDLATTELYYPEVARHAPKVLNSNTESPTTKPVTNAQAATSIRSDHLLRSPIAQDVDDAVTFQTAQIALPCAEAHLAFARMPSTTLVPGALVEIAAANRWSSESALVGTTWRVRQLSVHARASHAPLDQDIQNASTGYQIEISAELEDKDDPRIERPAFRAPSYPGLVEGKVVSEQGNDGDKTYQVYTNATTSLSEYHVKVPLWANQIVSAPFEPLQGSGNLYWPSYRDERVLLALDVHSAQIARLLEWRAGAVLSMDVQGEHLLFGKSDTSQTSVNHVYDGDNPVLNVARTHASDTALIKLSEGTLFLQVMEQEESA